MADCITLPELNCPFGDEISPHADRIDRHVLEWARCFSLLVDQAEIERFGRTRVGRLAARTSPRGGRHALELLADWQIWLFIFDDHICDESETGARPERLSRVITSLFRVMEQAGDQTCRVDPVTLAFGDLMDRLAAAASGPQLLRFVSAVRGYFLAQFWEAGHRADGVPAGLAEYASMRRSSGAVPSCIALIDFVDGFDLSTSDFCRRDVRALTDAAVNITCWANDILSYAKESERSLVVQSLPAVLAGERGLPPAEAIRAAAAMHDEEVARYLRAEPAVRCGATPELRRYLDGLRSWMGGNFHWSLETGRYGLASGGP